MTSSSRNVGDEEIFFINGKQLKGIVATATRVRIQDMEGILATYDVEGYGRTQEFFYPNNYDFNSIANKRRNRSLMPLEYTYKCANDFDWSLYSEDMTPIKKIVNSFVTQFSKYSKQGRGLYLSSKTKGSGKTMLSCCLANEILKLHDISVKFISALDYIELAKDRNELNKEKIKQICECRLLIIDDIGAEWGGKLDWTSTVMSHLIDYRDKQILTTIYTSNYDLHHLPGDDRMVDRIIGHSIPVIMPEDNIRRALAEKHTMNFLKTVLS